MHLLTVYYIFHFQPWLFNIQVQFWNFFTFLVMNVKWLCHYGGVRRWVCACMCGKCLGYLYEIKCFFLISWSIVMCKCMEHWMAWCDMFQFAWWLCGVTWRDVEWRRRRRQVASRSISSTLPPQQHSPTSEEDSSSPDVPSDSLGSSRSFLLVRGEVLEGFCCL